MGIWNPVYSLSEIISWNILIFFEKFFNLTALYNFSTLPTDLFFP